VEAEGEHQEAEAGSVLVEEEVAVEVVDSQEVAAVDLYQEAEVVQGVGFLVGVVKMLVSLVCVNFWRYGNVATRVLLGFQ
jgi:hypothetical protein